MDAALFAKIHHLQKFQIPLIAELGKAETAGRLAPHTLEVFLSELDAVERWTKRVEDTSDQETSVKIIPQASRNPDKKETDLDHVIQMEEISLELFGFNLYPTLKSHFGIKLIKDGILLHDGGEIEGVGDVTHANEQFWKENKTQRKAEEHVAFTTFFRKRTALKGLTRTLSTDLYETYFAEEFQLTKEGQFVVFLDHIQAVRFGIENIYPYEEIYRTPASLKYYLEEYLLRPTKHITDGLPGKAQKELQQFLIQHFDLTIIEKSYEASVMQGRLEKDKAEKLKKTAQDIVAALQD